MDDILYKNSWMNYLDDFYLQFHVIKYPKNMYFAANILSDYLTKNKTVYKEYPYAEKFDISTLNAIDWKNTTITFDKNSKIIVAPEPLKQLINLKKRLDFKTAESVIFSGFQIPFIQIKAFGIVVLIMVIILFIKICIYFDLIYRFQYF